MPYFSRGRNVAALVGATMLTAGAMGAGGILFYIVRRDHRICPRCGRTWGRWGERAVVRGPAGAPETAPPAVASVWGESSKRTWSTALFVLAALLAIGGTAATAAPALVAAGIAAIGGLLLYQAADGERQRRRAALISALQLPVLRLASQRGGRLTVTEVAAELGWTLPRAEKVLHSLDDGVRVDSEVTDEGLIVYQFRELLRPPGSPGSPGAEERA
ncbi:MAG TPA: hypothetical protein VFL93_04120 [Longimicrobiaceae bacterium]|nr:hypothetical protein [Longimicrobiaceae bacterium]